MRGLPARVLAEAAMRHVGGITVIVTLLLLFGCGEELSRVAYFKQKQRPTVTMSGEIKLDTVGENGDGRIKFQTADGRWWTTRMVKEATGYRYEDVKQDR